MCCSPRLMFCLKFIFSFQKSLSKRNTKEFWQSWWQSELFQGVLWQKILCFAAILLCGAYVYWLSVVVEGFLVCFDVCLTFATPVFENDHHSRLALSAESPAKTQLYPPQRVDCSNTTFPNCPSVCLTSSSGCSSSSFLISMLMSSCF